MVSSIPFISCSDDVGEREALRVLLLDFVPRMEGKWDYIGFQLRQSSLVAKLRSSPESNTQKLLHILNAWFDSNHLEAPVRAATVSTVLRSGAVKLDDVASDFAEVCLVHMTVYMVSANHVNRLTL